MMTEILKCILDNLVMISSFCIFMICCMLSNTVLGAVIASKTDLFTWKLFFSGLLKNIGIIIGIDILAVGLSGMTKLIEIYNIATEYTESIRDVSIISILSIIIYLSYTVYGKQAIEKIKSLESSSIENKDIDSYS